MNLSKMKNLAASLFGIDPARNTIKIDPANNAVDIAGQEIKLAAAGNTVKLDPANNTVQVGASSALTASNKTVTGGSAELWPLSAVKQRVSLVPLDGKIWIGPAGVTIGNGYPVEANERVEWETRAAAHAVSDSGASVDVRIILEGF